MRQRWSAIPEHARGPLLTGAFALLTVFGTTQPWTHGFRWSSIGLEYNYGLFTAVLAIEALLACWVRASGQLRENLYLGLGLASASVALIVAISFRILVIGDADPVAQQILWFRDHTLTIQASPGLYLSIAGASGQVLSLLWQWRDAHRAPQPPRRLRSSGVRARLRPTTISEPSAR